MCIWIPMEAKRECWFPGAGDKVVVSTAWTSSVRVASALNCELSPILYLTLIFLVTTVYL